MRPALPFAPTRQSPSRTSPRRCASPAHAEYLRTRPRPVAWTYAFCIAAVACSRPLALAPAQPPPSTAPACFGQYAATITGLANPSAVAVGPDELVYVADTGHHRVAVFDADGKLLRSFGTRGSAAGQLLSPEGIACTADGRVLVGDSGNHRICEFSSAGSFLRHWGGFGSAPGQFIRPRGLCPRGPEIIIADYGNDRVQVFDAGGRVLRALGGYGIEAVRLRRPADVAADDRGRLIVADADNHRLAVFDADGRPAAHWSQWGMFPGFLAQPSGLCARTGQVFVADAMNHRVAVFDAQGAPAYEWGIHAIQPREGEGRLHFPNDVAVAPSGAFAVVCEGFEDRCQVFRTLPGGAKPPPRPPLGIDPTGTSHFAPYAAWAGPLMMLAEIEADAVSIFDVRGTTPLRISAVAQHGSRPGQVNRPGGLAYDPVGRLLYVADTGNRRIQMFRIAHDPEPNPRYVPGLAQFVRLLDFVRLREQRQELKDRPPIAPTALCLTRAGRLYALDSDQSLLLELSAQLQLLAVRGGYGTALGRFVRPTDVATGADGRSILVVDALGRRVCEHDAAGSPRGEWPVPSPPGGAGGEPFGITTDPEGHVFLTDAAAHRVIKTDAEGRLLQAWGRHGLGLGEFFKPHGIIRHAGGSLLVVDYGNHRGWLFDPDGRPLDVFGARFFTAPARRALRGAPPPAEP